MMYAAYCEELRAVCRAKRIPLETIGASGKRGEYPLYKIVLNNTRAAQRTICFSAGIHGDETSAPIAVLEFLRAWKKERYPNVKIILFPVANPWGYDRGKNRNGAHRNLNRHFCGAPLRDENKLLYHAVKREHLDLFCALHEDDGKKDFYFYVYDRAKRWDPLYDTILKTAERFIPLCNHPTIYNLTATHGVVFNKRDGAFEDRLNRDGVPHSLCLEVSDTLPFESMIAVNLALMRVIARYRPHRL